MHELWRSRTGFILATIGAAVGMGNIWRFAYVAGENGGGVFLVAYLAMVAAVGLPLVIAELALGKRGAADAVTAFEVLAPRSPARHAGWLGVLGATLILSYYSVIAGWALRYFTAAAVGGLWEGAAEGFGGYFQRFIAATGQPLGWQFAMLAATMFVVAGGVRAGIERLNAILMPLLALIVIGLAAYALTLPGAGAGVAFLLAPDWEAGFQPQVLLAALGQAFFSIGVGMAVYITYGSYMRPEFRVPGSAATIVVGDTLFAIVAGLAIFPAVFALGADPAAGPELAFITLPQVFLAMPGGMVIGPIFFFLLSAAALTSMISLLEVPVAVAVHRWRIGRWRAVLLLGGAIFVIGIPSGLSYGVLDAVTVGGLPVLDAADFAVTNLLMPLAGLALALFLGWRVLRPTVLELAEFRSAALGGLWLAALRWLVPLLILLAMAYAVLG